MPLEPQVKLEADLKEAAAYLQTNGQARLARGVLDGLKVQLVLHAALEVSTTLAQQAIRGEFRAMTDPSNAAMTSTQAGTGMNSVLQDWVMELPLRAQGTLLTGIRGGDLTPKTPPTIDETYGCSTSEGSAERHLQAFLRFCILNPADRREVDIPGAWFQSTPPAKWKPSQFGHYPLHWYSHLMHCFEVVGYLSPHKKQRDAALAIYLRLARNFHLNAETKEQMFDRLTEDRIAIGEVVS